MSAIGVLCVAVALVAAHAPAHLFVDPAATREPLALSPHPLRDARWAEAWVRAARAEERAHRADRRHPALIGAVILDVRRGEVASIAGDVPMALASGIKLFIMLEAFRQRAAGTLRFNETVAYTPDFIRDGAPTMNRRAVGSVLTVDELVTLMIRDSDNAATDMLLARVGADAVHRTMLAFGHAGAVSSMLEQRRAVYRTLDPRADTLDTVALRDIRWRNGYAPRLDLLRKHIGPPEGAYDEDDLDRAFAAAYARGDNHAPMRTVAAMLQALALRRLVSPSASEEMLRLLGNVATSHRRVEGALPPDVGVFHKTGTAHKRVCDLGIVMLPDGAPLVVAIAVAGGERERAEDIIARLSRRAWDAAVRLH